MSLRHLCYQIRFAIELNKAATHSCGRYLNVIVAVMECPNLGSLPLNGQMLLIVSNLGENVATHHKCS